LHLKCVQSDVIKLDASKFSMLITGVRLSGPHVSTNSIIQTY